MYLLQLARLIYASFTKSTPATPTLSPLTETTSYTYIDQIYARRNTRIKLASLRGRKDQTSAQHSRQRALRGAFMRRIYATGKSPSQSVVFQRDDKREAAANFRQSPHKLV